MALIKCPECGQEISDKSSVCIHCGYPIKESPKDEPIASSGNIRTINGVKFDITPVIELMNSNQEIAAIKILRENTKLDLAEAKKYVESLP